MDDRSDVSSSTKCVSSQRRAAFAESKPHSGWPRGDSTGPSIIPSDTRTYPAKLYAGSNWPLRHLGQGTATSSGTGRVNFFVYPHLRQRHESAFSSSNDLSRPIA